MPGHPSQSGRVFGTGEVAPTLDARASNNPQVLVPPPRTISNFGTEIAGTLTARYDSSPCADRGVNCITTT